MSVYLPPAPAEDEEFSTVVAVGSDAGRAAYFLHEGKQGQAERATEDVVKGTARSADVFRPLNEAMPEGNDGTAPADAPELPPRSEPHRIVTGKRNQDGSIEMREQSVARDKPKSDGTPGPINVKEDQGRGPEDAQRRIGAQDHPTAKAENPRGVGRTQGTTNPEASLGLQG